MGQINDLHNSCNLQQFNARWEKISAIWLRYPTLERFHAYFKRQWIDSSFCNWAVFHTPPGYTTTNNPIESYNKSIKHFSTNRLKLNLIPALNMFKELIYNESLKNFDNETLVKITKTL